MHQSGTARINTRLIAIKVMRVPGNPLIKGTLAGRREAKSHCNDCKWFTAILNVCECTLTLCLLPPAEFET